MTVATDHTPTGTLNTSEDTYIEGGAELYFGSFLQYAPDANGYYWGIVGTTGSPVEQIGCYENFQLTDDVEINELRCDTVGVIGETVRRNFLEATFDLQAILPLTQLEKLLRLSSSLSVPGEDVEYAGIGEVTQDQLYKAYFSRIYDAAAGDWLSVTGHRVSFRWSGALQMRYGEKWMVGITARFYADTSLPSDQQFATLVRYDPSAI